MMNNKNDKDVFWFEDNKKLKLQESKLKTKNKQIYKELTIRGIGSKAWLGKEKTHMHMDVGYTHYISIKVPNKIDPLVKKTRMIFFSPLKKELGIFASSVKELKQPDPYKGEGIRYKGEEIKLKVGKVKT